MKALDVTILLQDYRDLNDQFDRIVSVGDVRARRTEKITIPILRWWIVI